MKKLLVLIVVFGFAGVSWATEEAGQTEKIEKKVEISKEANDLLDKVELAAGKLKTYQAKMKYTMAQPELEIVTTQNGSIFYKVEKDAILARMNFDDMLQQDVDELEDDPADWAKPVKFNDDYVFDGMWLTRRNDRTKMIQKWQVAKDKKDRDAFRIGKGPFPLPFSIKKDDLIKYFGIKIIVDKKLEAKELKNTVHIELIPLKESVYAKEYVKLELWMDVKNYLPVQIRYEKGGDRCEITTVLWTDIKIDDKKGIAADIFIIDENIGAGWQKEVTPMKNKS
ncbi:MAG: hypothetical protein JEZ07_05720 [Phycisphaerae bacterium]|nr:hypothetical protein [Phycisphaerae bacterium]